jgi:DNA (cytosine-5)-methyltransferase 1
MASEVNRECRETYKANFGEDEPLLGDINCIDAKILPEFDILTAGFPCQSFSIAGDMRGLFDETGRLFFEMLRIIKHCQPPALLLENVPNLLEIDSGKIWANLKGHLEDSGYFVHH